MAHLPLREHSTHRLNTSQIAREDLSSMRIAEMRDCSLDRAGQPFRITEERIVGGRLVSKVGSLLSPGRHAIEYCVWSVLQNAAVRKYHGSAITVSTSSLEAQFTPSCSAVGRRASQYRTEMRAPEQIIHSFAVLGWLPLAARWDLSTRECCIARRGRSNGILPQADRVEEWPAGLVTAVYQTTAASVKDRRRSVIVEVQHSCRRLR